MLVRYSTDEKGNPVKEAVIYTKEEHKIPLSEIDPNAITIVKRLNDYGFTAYIVGGAVRDLVLGRTPKDFDIVTDATPSRIKKIFHNSRIIGKRFRLVHVIFGQKIFEVSTFRSICDGSVGNVFGTIEEDVKRRDFTLNALYYDPIHEQVIDYVDGLNDIKKGIVKPVIPLDVIFEDDPVRMLRAIKYSATTHSVLPHNLKKKIRQSANLLSPVSPSRLTEELVKILNSGHSAEIVSLAMDVDLFEYLQPAATSMIEDSKAYRKNYYESLKALDEKVETSLDLRLGEKLYFIIRDFVASLTDWSKEIKSPLQAADLYKRTWASCRNFVLPMNPQRSELDFAVRKILSEYGVQLKAPKRKHRYIFSSEEESQEESNVFSKRKNPAKVASSKN